MPRLIMQSAVILCTLCLWDGPNVHIVVDSASAQLKWRKG